MFIYLIPACVYGLHASMNTILLLFFFPLAGIVTGYPGNTKVLASLM